MLQMIATMPLMLVASVNVRSDKCMPSNGIFRDGLAPMLNRLTAGIGGLIFPIASFVLVVVIVVGLIAVLRKRGAQEAIGAVSALFIVLALGIGGFLLLAPSVFGEINNVC